MCPLRVRTSAPVVASHTFAVRSSLAVTIRDPSGLNDAELTRAGVPLEGEELGPGPRVPHLRRPVLARGDDPRPVRAERRRSDATGVPLEGEELGPALRVPHLRRPVLTAGDDPRPVRAERRRMTASVCPLRVRSSAPVFASHTFAVSSSLAVTIRDPSGLNDADDDAAGVPLEGEELGPVLASHTFAVPSRLPVTTREPSGLNAAERDAAGVPLEGEELGPAPRVPHLRRPVLTAR